VGLRIKPGLEVIATTTGGYIQGHNPPDWDLGGGKIQLVLQFKFGGEMGYDRDAEVKDRTDRRKFTIRSELWKGRDRFG